MTDTTEPYRDIIPVTGLLPYDYFDEAIEQGYLSLKKLGVATHFSFRGDTWMVQMNPYTSNLVHVKVAVTSILAEFSKILVGERWTEFINTYPRDAANIVLGDNLPVSGSVLIQFIMFGKIRYS